MIKTVIFDAFDTLFQVEKGASAKYIIDRIIQCGYTVEVAEFHKLWKEYYTDHTSADEIFKTEREIFIARIKMLYNKYGVSHDAVADAHMLMEKSKNRCVFEDVIPTLENLKGICNIYIGSNTDNDLLEAVMQKNGITVDKIYTSESLRCYKPSAEFYNAIIKENGLLYNEVLFVGDSLTDDVLGPQNVNIKTCWLNREEKPRTEITPDYEIQSLMELTHIIG